MLELALPNYTVVAHLTLPLAAIACDDCNIRIVASGRRLCHPCSNGEAIVPSLKSVDALALQQDHCYGASPPHTSEQLPCLLHLVLVRRRHLRQRRIVDHLRGSIQRLSPIMMPSMPPDQGGSAQPDRFVDGHSLTSSSRSRKIAMIVAVMILFLFFKIGSVGCYRASANLQLI